MVKIQMNCARKMSPPCLASDYQKMKAGKGHLELTSDPRYDSELANKKISHEDHQQFDLLSQKINELLFRKNQPTNISVNGCDQRPASLLMMVLRSPK